MCWYVNSVSDQGQDVIYTIFASCQSGILLVFQMQKYDKAGGFYGGSGGGGGENSGVGQ
jgi:hypothetical protein